MQTIQKGSSQKIYLNVYKDGVLTQASSAPTLYIYNADDDTSPIGTNLPSVSETADGVYSYMLAGNYTLTQRVLEVRWLYVLDGFTYTESNFYAVETTYADHSEIIDFLNFGAKPSDPNFHPISEIASAEKIARTIIDGYTGQKFSKRSGSQEVFGKGSDACQLTEKMITIEKVWENDMLLIDNTVDPVYNTFGFGLELSPTGFAARIINAGWDVRYDNQMDPTISNYGRFRDGSRYKFQGTIGYKYVPEDIKIATMLLVNDILSNDYNWRNKYLSKVDLSEISFEMSKGAFNGTGNITVDNILDQYRHTNIVII